MRKGITFILNGAFFVSTLTTFLECVQSDWEHFKMKPILSVGQEDVSM